MSRAVRAPRVLRGLVQHAPVSALIGLVALVGAAAAAAGPTYYQAAQRSILADALASTPVDGRGVAVVQGAVLRGALAPLRAETLASLDAAVGPGRARRVFAPAVGALEANGQKASESLSLVWRSDVCAHLTLLSGTCPRAKDEIMVSTSLAAVNRWRVGQRVRIAPWGPLDVTAIYRPPVRYGDYWFDESSTYFPSRAPASYGALAPPAYDALFTPQSTITEGPAHQQGNAVIDVTLRRGKVRPGDVAALESGVGTVVSSPSFNELNATVSSTVPATMASVRRSWRSLAVPVLVVTAELLALAWLLLLIVVADASEARGGEIALARLRGWGRARVIWFGLSESMTLLVAALPAGAVVGWATTVVMARRLLRAGTEVDLPALAWAAAAAATVGGLIAVGLAARQVLGRPVVDQWRATAPGATRRGWIVDTALVTAAAGGLVEISAGHGLAGPHHGVLGLLVPGLVGVAVAVVASRLLPLSGRGVARLTRGRGGLGAFLASRQIGRRPGGTRTTMLLAASFALTTFAMSAWLVAQANYRRVADVRTGAPAVLTVAVPPGMTLSTAVDRADPAGARAAAVEVAAGSPPTLAVQPARFARIATWRQGAALSPAKAAADLAPPAPAPLTLRGRALEVTLRVQRLGPYPAVLGADIVIPGAGGPTPVPLGLLPTGGAVTLRAGIVGCPCTFQDLTIDTPTSRGGTEQGGLTITDLRELTSSGWRPIPGALRTRGRWRGSTLTPGLAQVSTIETPYGLSWQFRVPADDPATLVAADRPAALPALASASEAGAASTTGLDDTSLAVHVVATAPAIPGLPTGGLVVDGRFALLAAAGNTAQATEQVWVTTAGLPAVRRALRREGIEILSTATESATAAMLARQGPGLAGVLFFIDAGAGTVLAVTGAVAGLYSTARRRRYELAALHVAGVSSGTLGRALVLEQTLGLLSGTVAGVAAGLAAVAVALRFLPEFVVPPAVRLAFTPPATTLALVLAGIVVGLSAVSLAATTAILRGARPEALREAP